jgi:hypothetical protein
MLDFERPIVPPGKKEDQIFQVFLGSCCPSINTSLYHCEAKFHNGSVLHYLSLPMYFTISNAFFTSKVHIYNLMVQ